MKDSEVFEQARTVLNVRGRTVNVWEDANTSVCVNGACNVARHGQTLVLYPAAHEPQLQKAMRSLGIEGFESAMEYNDEPATTDEDIDALLERAAKLAEQRGQ